MVYNATQNRHAEEIGRLEYTIGKFLLASNKSWIFSALADGV